MQNNGDLQKATANFCEYKILNKGKKNVDSINAQLHWPHNQVYWYLHCLFRKNAAAEGTNLFFNEFMVIM